MAMDPLLPPAIVIAVLATSRIAGRSQESETILRPRQTLCREAAPPRKGRRLEEYTEASSIVPGIKPPIALAVAPNSRQ
jgi:hypothetical protein